MRIHYFQHVPFENPAFVLSWAEKNNHQLSKTLLFNNDPLPSPNSFDLCVVMGGPMNIYEYESYPWLKNEKEFLKQCIDSEKFILGICLGAQLLANVLGANIFKNDVKEIGWFPVSLSKEICIKSPFDKFPKTFMPLHWHGDTFLLPEGTLRIASTEVCQNQGFMYNERVIGLQFHLESTLESINALINNCSDELVDAPYIQKADDIRSKGKTYIRESNQLMESLLDNWITL